MPHKYSPQEAYCIAENLGIELLEPYKRLDKPIQFQCYCGKIDKLSFQKIEKGSVCLECRKKQTRNRHKFHINEVKKELFQKNLTLLSDYKNARSKITVQCELCKNKYSVSFASIRASKGCRYCSYKIRAKSQKMNTDEINQFFKKHNCELLSTSYKNAHQKLDFVCSCGRQTKITWNNFRNRKRCYFCGIEARSGKNHYEWSEDRIDQYYNELFRHRCYKILRYTFNRTGDKKSSSTSKVLGYTPEELKNHIVNHPNWKKISQDNWHIDHIFPIKAFLDYGVKDPSIINSLDNLQPLNANSNLKKNKKYSKKKFEKWLKFKNIEF